MSVWGNSDQSVTVTRGAVVANWADQDAIAQQSLSSNVGNVTVGHSIQTTSVVSQAVVQNSASTTGAKAGRPTSLKPSAFTGWRKARAASKPGKCWR